MAKITGVGGIFFKCPDPKVLLAWYHDVLGLAAEEWGGVLFKPGADAPPMFVFAPFSQSTDYFAPSIREFTINFAVDDLDGMVARIASKGVEILRRDDVDPNGRFAWLLDPAGTKIELWEPKK